MKHILSVDDINRNEDELLEKKRVVLNDGKMNYSEHLVETYSIANGPKIGSLYHYFTYIDGKSVMNYNPEDYYNLSEFVSISFRFTIFFKMKDYEVPVPINPDYRLKYKDSETLYSHLSQNN